MGIRDWFSTESINPINTIDKGREAFMYFHNQSTKYQGYDYSADQAMAIIATNGGIERQSDQITSIFLDGLGSAIESVQSGGFLGGGGLQDAMETLADKAQGKLPHSTSFFQAVGDKASNPSFIDVAVAVVPEVGAKVVQGAQAIGDSVITTGKWLTMLMPVVVVGAVLFIATQKTKRLAG